MSLDKIFGLEKEKVTLSISNSMRLQDIKEHPLYDLMIDFAYFFSIKISKVYSTTDKLSSKEIQTVYHIKTQSRTYLITESTVQRWQFTDKNANLYEAKLIESKTEYSDNPNKISFVLNVIK